MSYTFAVITKTDIRDMAVPLDVYVETAPGTPENDWTPVIRPLHETLSNPVQIIMLRQPVWVLGEIVVLGDDGREINGEQRKPSKWWCEVEEFDSIDEAIGRAQQVTAT